MGLSWSVGEAESQSENDRRDKGAKPMSTPPRRPCCVQNLLSETGEHKVEATLLVDADELQVVRVICPAGHESSKHYPTGATTVQCLEGRVAMTVGRLTQWLSQGQLLFLDEGEPHSFVAAADSTLLFTTALAKWVARTRRRGRPGSVRGILPRQRPARLHPDQPAVGLTTPARIWCSVNRPARRGVRRREAA